MFRLKPGNQPRGNVSPNNRTGSARRQAAAFVQLARKRPVSMAATVCYQSKELVEFQFQDVDPSRKPAKDWISSFLGLD